MSKEERARIARENGAKSRGPKTEAGRRRIAQANSKHGLYAVSATVLDIESHEAFNVLRDAAFAQWNPRNAFESQYVEEIADCSWRIARLRLCATHQGNVSIKQLRQAADHPISNMDAITKTELDGSTVQGPQSMLQRRVNVLILNRTMITADLRALRGVPVLGITQETLQAQALPVDITQQRSIENPNNPN
jgi:hypothetical protein